MQAGMERTKAAQLVNGTISQGKSRGILTYANGTTYGTIEQASSITNDKIGWDDMFKTLPSKLKEKYRANASYLMAKGTFFDLLIEKDTVGRYQVAEQINFFSGDKMSISGSSMLYPRRIYFSSSSATPLALSLETCLVPPE